MMSMQANADYRESIGMHTHAHAISCTCNLGR